MDERRKTTLDHWDACYTRPPRPRLPSAWNVGVRNSQVLLRRHVRAGDRFLEIGCAPGKMLAWVGAALGGKVAGLDYSPHGLAFTRTLLARLGIEADLRCEDLDDNTFERASFDVVYSSGFIEHFDEPSGVVRRHVELVKPGGLALLTVPNYGGWYGRCQCRLDPENLAIHNLRIMSPEGLRGLAPGDLCREVRAYPSGRPSPWILSMERRWPRKVAFGTSLVLNTLAHLQPVTVPALCPMLVLEIRR